MRVIPRKFHAVLDYIFGIILIISPWSFGLIQNEPASTVTYLTGIAVIIISFNTDYEGGVTKMLTMHLHLNIDVLGGIFLAASPWIFGFYDQTFIFHFIMGIVLLITGILTIDKSQHPNSEHIDDYNAKPLDD